MSTSTTGETKIKEETKVKEEVEEGEEEEEEEGFDMKDEYLDEDDEDDEEDLEYDSSSPAGGEMSSLVDSSQRDDKNNNNSTSPSKKGRKTKRLGVKRTYGLRPRTQLRRPSYDCEAEEKEHLGGPQRKESRGKVRGSLMQKYRRLTANARERQRMKEINDAFSTLQGILPALQGRPSASATGGASSRTSMTKIRTLRHAASYIQALSDLLSGAEPAGPQSFHKDLQSYGAVTHSAPSGPTPVSQGQEIYCGLQQQALTKGHLSRGPDFASESYKGSFLTNAERVHGESPLSAPVERNLPWEDVATSDEELFSILEKEVLNMRNTGGLHQGDANSGTLGDLGWNEEFVPMGCK